MRPTTDRFAYYAQDGRCEHVRVMSFVEALRLTDAGQRIIFRKTAEKAKASQVVPLKKCHDGVWRMLAEAPKFQSGGRIYRFSEKFEWTEEQREYLRAFQRANGFEFVVPNSKTKP